MPYRWIEHTAELGLEIGATSPETVFAEAAAAFGELVGDEGKGEPAVHENTVAGNDYADLLVAWLEQLVFLAETEDFVPELADVELAEGSMRARVHGRRGTPRHLVKAVTYHDLSFMRDGTSWRAKVVLDV